jgi:hypothetical protein
MRVVVTGDFKEPVLLDTTKATGLLIYSDKGEPNTIYRMVGDGMGWIRFTKGEDKNFYDVARQLGLISVDN